MATWNDVVDFVKKNCKGSEKDGILEAVPTFDDGRSQIVWLRQIDFGDDVVWVEICSPVGEIQTKDMDAALITLGQGLCGGLVKLGKAHFVKHCMPIGDLSIGELLGPMRLVALSADTLEKQIFGEDKL